MGTKAFVINILVLCTISNIFCEEIVVETSEGKLAGSQETTVWGGKTYYSFKGIPYAKPPVGTHRFKAPEDPEPWEGVRNATAHGNVCPQYNPITGIYTPGDEDCLFLNVYTPNCKPKTPLPVLFYIHGGAYLFGDGNANSLGPDTLLQSQEIVLLTFNYRLDALGFLCMGTEDVPGNAALKDQVAALKWVQKNIVKFGGDPKKVTIMGGTAGAASVGFHLISPMSKGLFHRAISMSGAPSCDFAYGYQSERRAFALVKMLGNYTITDPADALEYLQSVAVEKLVNAKPTVLASEEITSVLLKAQPFTPVVEINFGKGNNFITEDPFGSLKCQNINKAEVMFSYNTREALLLINLYISTLAKQYNTYPELYVPSKMLFNQPPNTILKVADKITAHYLGKKPVSTDNIAEFIHYASMAGISYDVQRYYKRISECAKTYFFKFESYSNRNSYGQAGEKYGIRNSTHFDDVPYLFYSTSLNTTLEENTREYKMVENIVTAVTNFVKYGNPSPSCSSLGVDWPEFNNKTKAYVSFGDEMTVGAAADEEDMQFWRSIYEELGMDF